MNERYLTVVLFFFCCITGFLLGRRSGGALRSSALACIGRRAGCLTSLLLACSGGLLALLCRRGCRAAGANGTHNDENHCYKQCHQAARNFGHRLDSTNGILLGEDDEVIYLLANESDRVLLEADTGGGKLLFLLGLEGLLLRCFNGALNIKGFLSEFLGILHGVADVDVIKEDVVLHGPDFKADL